MQPPVEDSAPEVPLITGDEALPAGHPPIDAPPPISSSDPMPSDHPSIDEDNPGSLDEEDFGHPELSGSEIKIIVPEEVQSKWQTVILGVANAAEKSEVQAQIGVPTVLEKSGLVLLVEAFLPSYTSDFNTITSISNELDNPAAMIQLKSGDEVVARGWVFKNLPEYNTFKHASVVLTLQTAGTADAE
ncbi:MAG: hypothetical protein L3J28_02125 [Candidatus Polarisedimenticolaceae bacterium]|nr:hypothetical protein [Candidatus Polarisedimenticolaceae bacterium]